MRKPTSCSIKWCDNINNKKKGAWSPEEDQKLIDFLSNNNGHHVKWKSLPMHAGLLHFFIIFLSDKIEE